jgi:hypothetical protein
VTLWPNLTGGEIIDLLARLRGDGRRSQREPGTAILLGRLNGTSVGAFLAARWSAWGAAFAVLLTIFIVVGGTHPPGAGDRLWSSAWSIALTWTAVALVGVIGVFGPPLQWPAWMMDISPYTQIPGCPAEPRRRRRCSGSAPRSATGSSSTRALSHPGKPRTTSRAWPLAFPHD